MAQRFVARRNGDIKTDNPNFARCIGTTLVTPLFTVLDETGKPVRCELNLAVMDLLRGYMLRMPTGQAVANELIATGRNIRILTSKEIEDSAGANKKQRAILQDPAFRFSSRTPLWFHILAEADRLGEGGKKLGPVGSTIVAEVLVALVRRSPQPILPKAGSNPDDKPFTPNENSKRRIQTPGSSEIGQGPFLESNQTTNETTRRHKMTNILDNILAVKQRIIDEGQGSPTAIRLRRKALDAILGGSTEWVDYMREFANTPEELARLIPTDGSETDDGMNDARAYLVAKSPCGTDTVTTFEDGITVILDQVPTP